MVRYFTSLLSMSLVAAVLSGCVLASTTGGMLGTVFLGTQASLSFTKKLPTDHIAETVTGLDCDYNRSLKDGGYLCRPLDSHIIEAPVYCYSTLGTVDCYNQPLNHEASRMVK